MYTGITKGL